MTTTGRSRSNDVILNDSRISSIHCRIFKGVEQQDGSHQMLVEDTSSNGTKIQRAGQVGVRVFFGGRGCHDASALVDSGLA